MTTKKQIAEDVQRYISAAVKASQAASQLARALDQALHNMAGEGAEFAATENPDKVMHAISMCSYPVTATMQAVESSSFMDGKGTGVEDLVKIIWTCGNEAQRMSQVLADHHDEISDKREFTN